MREPWLWAITAHYKTVENRSPGMAAMLRTGAGERIGLHGATTWSKRGQHDPRVVDAYGGQLPKPEKVNRYLVHPVCDGFGLIVATAIVDNVHLDVGCCRPWGESEYRDSTGQMVRGVCHLVLAEVELLDVAIPARGQLGLWHSTELDEVYAA